MRPDPDQICMEQTATAASIPGTTEDYTLDWQWRTNHDAFFAWKDVADGSLKMRLGRGVAEGKWLKNESDGKLTQAVGKKPDEICMATHSWGSEEVGGARRHTRRVGVVGKDREEIKVRMVYDFLGE